MKTRLLLTLAILSLAAIRPVSAELYEGEVRGVAGKLGKSDHDGFSVLLVNTGSDLIHGILTIDVQLGPVETAALMLFDRTGKEIAQIPIQPEDIETGKKDFEFQISRELLEHSCIAVSHRDKNDLYVAKVLLGTFVVIDKIKR